MPEDIYIIFKIKEINQKSFHRLFTVSCNSVLLASGHKENYKKKESRKQTKTTMKYESIVYIDACMYFAI